LQPQFRNMQREFSLNIILLISVNLLIKPFFIFGIDRTVQNVVGTETYGVYGTLLSIAYLFQIINDFGIQNFNSREISQHRQMIGKYFPNILILKTGLAIIFIATVFVFGYWAGYGAYWHLLLFLAFNQILVSLIFYFRSNIAGLGHYRTDSLLSALDKLLMIIFCSILLWGISSQENFTIDLFVYAQTAALLITAILTLVVLGRKLPNKLTFNFNPKVAWVLLKKSFPFALVILLMTIYTRIDVLMIDKMLPNGSYHVGVYIAGYRLLDASNMIGFLFASLLLPMLSRMLKIGEPVNELVQTGFKMIFAGSVSLAVAVFFFKYEIVELLYVEATPYFGDVLGWLMFSFIAVAGTYVYGSLMLANGNLTQLNRIFLFSIVFNIALNLVLIPKYNATGAAISTILTQWGVFFAEVYLSKKEGLLNARFDLIAQFAVFFGISMIITYFVSVTFPGNRILLFIIAFFINLTLAGLFKFIRPAFVLDILRRKK